MAGERLVLQAAGISGTYCACLHGFVLPARFGDERGTINLNRALIDDKGDNVKEALPSTPVQVLGFDVVPAAGDEFRVTDKEKTARDIAELREQRYRSADLRKSSAATGAGARLEDIFEQIQRGETATLNLVLKADVQGSLEAVTESLRKLEREEVKLAFVHRAVGGITEYDVTLAAASNATSPKDSERLGTMQTSAAR